MLHFKPSLEFYAFYWRPLSTGQASKFMKRDKDLGCPTVFWQQLHAISEFIPTKSLVKFNKFHQFDAMKALQKMRKIVSYLYSVLPYLLAVLHTCGILVQIRLESTPREVQS